MTKPTALVQTFGATLTSLHVVVPFGTSVVTPLTVHVVKVVGVTTLGAALALAIGENRPIAKVSTPTIEVENVARNLFELDIYFRPLDCVGE